MESDIALSFSPIVSNYKIENWIKNSLGLRKGTAAYLRL